MLTALNNEGELITLIGKMRDRAVNLRCQQQFFCPICKEPLILKAGHFRVPHFSHQKYSTCSQISTEPESPQHLQGKLDLYEWCKLNQMKVCLEHYLPSIVQRPDLFVEVAGRHFAIEYQCTPISVQTVKKRSSKYIQEGISPIWIAGGFPYQKRESHELFLLTEYLWSLTFKEEHGTMLVSYRPESKAVYTLTNITSYTSRKISAGLKKIPLAHVNLPFSPPHLKNDFCPKRWLKEKRSWVEQKVKHGSIVQDRFLNAVYVTGHNPFLLSPVIGLPVPFMESFQSHPVEWQFFIWYDCFSKLEVNKKISLKYVYFKLAERISGGDLLCRILPLHETESWKHAVRCYFDLLKKLFYFQKSGKDLYTMIQSLPNPLHVEKIKVIEENLFKKIVWSDINGNDGQKSCFLFDRQDFSYVKEN